VRVEEGREGNGEREVTQDGNALERGLERGTERKSQSAKPPPSIPPSLPPSLPSVPVDKLGPFRLQVGADAAQGAAFVDGRLHMREGRREGGRGSVKMITRQGAEGMKVERHTKATVTFYEIEARGCFSWKCRETLSSMCQNVIPYTPCPPSLPPSLPPSPYLEVAHVKLLAQGVEVVRLRHAVVGAVECAGRVWVVCRWVGCRGRQGKRPIAKE